MQIVSQDGLLMYDWEDVEQLVAYNNSEAVGYAMLGHRDKWVIVAETEGEASLMGEYTLKSQMEDVIDMWRKALRDEAPGDVFRFPKEEEIPFK